MHFLNFQRPRQDTGGYHLWIPVKMWEWLDPIAVLTCVDDLLLIGYLLDDLLMVSCTSFNNVHPFLGKKMRQENE